MTLSFLPQIPFTPGPVLLFGVLLLAGLVGGEFAQRILRLPRITGYVLMGMLLAGSGLGVVNEALLAQASIFVDIALGLILFELGRRLNLDWLARDRWLLASGVLESTLCFFAIFIALVAFNISALYAALAAAIGVSTSPAVVMVMAKELKAEGQVTERTLHLVAVNSVIAFTLATVLLPWLHHEYEAGWLVALLHPLYLFAGSLGLGYLVAACGLLLLRMLGKHPERQFVVLLGLVVFTVGICAMLELSVLLALLALGVLVRRLDRRHDLLPVDIGRIGTVFFMILFVVAGASVPVSHLATGGGLALVYILARFVGKSLGVLLVTPLSGVRPGSAGLLCIALTPMSGFALAMLQGTTRVSPEFGVQVGPIVFAAVLMLELIGPVAVQFALKRAGEVGQEEVRLAWTR
jgi:Kef-type K+ transport system membrane component KefB